MNVLVIGCGRQGSLLARMLDENGHDVAVVDADADQFNRLGDEFDGMTVEGIPMDMDVLKNAGVENCDAVAVVTPDDNLNITVSQIVRRFFHVENVVARISDVQRETVFEKLGLKTVCPTKMAGDAIYTALLEPFEEKRITFGTSTVGFVAREVEKHLYDCNVNLYPLREGESVLGVVHQDGRMELNQEHHKIILSPGDKIIVAVPVD